MSVLPTLFLKGKIYVVSDVHLGPHIPLTNQAFFQFLHHANTSADALILAGDIFNMWFGDDLKVSEPWLRDALNAFKQLRIPTYFIHGNRDFLVGKALCESLHLQLLPEQIRLQTDLGVFFISHGDELCTLDKNYQRLRFILRQPSLQSLFLRLPTTWRYKIAKYLRKKSQSAQNTKSDLYHRKYDVDPQALENIIQQYPDIDAIIHGHTHKEAIHPILALDHKERLRYVLSDWDLDHAQRAGYLCLDEKGLSLKKFIPTF